MLGISYSLCGRNGCRARHPTRVPKTGGIDSEMIPAASPAVRTCPRESRRAWEALGKGPGRWGRLWPGGGWSRVATLHPAYPVARGATAGRLPSKMRQAAAAGAVDPLGRWPGDACGLVWALCGRESIFLFSHTNEFCGKSKVALEARVAWAGLKRGRRVCERGQMRKRLPACCRACKRVRRPVQRLRHPIEKQSYLILQKPSAGLLLRLVGHWPSPLESHRGESPPTKSAALGPYGVLGMPKGGGRLVPPFAEGWALWATGRWQVLPPEQREIAPVQRTPNGRSCAAGSSSWGP